MTVSEECAFRFRKVFDGIRWAQIAREQLRMGRVPEAQTSIGWLKFTLESMKEQPEYSKALDYAEKAQRYAETNLDMAIGYLVDVEPLVETGALQTVVACECKK